MRQEGQIYRIARPDEDVRESGLLAKLLASAGAAATVVSQFAGKTIIREPVPIEKDEPLKLELASFVDAVRERRAPVVSGEQAKRALDVALAITQQIRGGK
jgi:predicted dehydrogenase